MIDVDIEIMTRAMSDAQAPSAHVVVAQKIAQGLKSGLTLSAQPGAAPTAATAVPWAVEVVRAHRALGQPFANQVRLVIAAAIECLGPLVNHGIAVAIDWQATLIATASDLSTAGVDIPEFDASALLAELGQAAADSIDESFHRRVSREFIGVLHEGSVGSAEFAERVTQTARSTTSWSSQSLADAVEGPDREFLILLGLTGVTADTRYTSMFTAGQLRHVDSGLENPYREWGTHGHEARIALNAMKSPVIRMPHVGERPLGAGLFLQGAYHARWRAGAVSVAIGDAQRLASRVALAHPRVNVEVFPFAFTLDRTSGTVKGHELEHPPLRNARLEVPASSALEAAVDAAYRTRGPRNSAHRASLSWVSLEVLGFEGGLSPTGREGLDDLSKVLSLHQLRQLLTLSFRTLISSCGANSQESRQLAQKAHRYYRRAKRRVHDAAGLQSNQEAHLTVAIRNQLNGHLLQVLSSRMQEIEQRRRALILDLGLSSATAESMTLMTHLEKVPMWISALRDPARPFEPLEDASPAWVQALVNEARAVVESPTSVREYLQDLQPWLRQQLQNLYVVRNMHLHAGVQEFRGDEAMASLGAGAVDALYEILGLWSTSQDRGPRPTVSKIAEAFDALTVAAAPPDLATRIDSLLAPAGDHA